MKSLLSALLIFSVAKIALAQEPPLPAATTTPMPSVTPAPTRPELNIPDIPMTVEPSPLVPNTSPTPKKNVPSITELDAAFQQSSLGKEVEQQRLHLEWRKLKNRTSDDPEILAAKNAAAAARTELDKRNKMRAYYKTLYGRMQALADTPELKAYLEQRKQDAINSLAQPHVRPETAASPTRSP